MTNDLGLTASTGCACGCSDTGVPELDVRTIPHAIRHGVVFGALSSVPVGGSMVLVAPHDPQPLLRQRIQLADARSARFSHLVNLDGVPYKRAVEVSEDPRLTGELPREAAPQIPIIQPDSGVR